MSGIRNNVKNSFRNRLKSKFLSFVSKNKLVAVVATAFIFGGILAVLSAIFWWLIFGLGALCAFLVFKLIRKADKHQEELNQEINQSMLSDSTHEKQLVSDDSSVLDARSLDSKLAETTETIGTKDKL